MKHFLIIWICMSSINLQAQWKKISNPYSLSLGCQIHVLEDGRLLNRTYEDAFVVSNKERDEWTHFNILRPGFFDFTVAYPYIFQHNADSLVRYSIEDDQIEVLPFANKNHLAYSKNKGLLSFENGHLIFSKDMGESWSILTHDTSFKLSVAHDLHRIIVDKNDNLFVIAKSNWQYHLYNIDKKEEPILLADSWTFISHVYLENKDLFYTSDLSYHYNIQTHQRDTVQFIYENNTLYGGRVLDYRAGQLVMELPWGDNLWKVDFKTSQASIIYKRRYPFCSSFSGLNEIFVSNHECGDDLELTSYNIEKQTFTQYSLQSTNILSSGRLYSISDNRTLLRACHNIYDIDLNGWERYLIPDSLKIVKIFPTGIMLQSTDAYYFQEHKNQLLNSISVNSETIDQQNFRFRSSGNGIMGQLIGKDSAYYTANGIDWHGVDYFENFYPSHIINDSFLLRQRANFISADSLFEYSLDFGKSFSHWPWWKINNTNVFSTQTGIYWIKNIDNDSVHIGTISLNLLQSDTLGIVYLPYKHSNLVSTNNNKLLIYGGPLLYSIDVITGEIKLMTEGLPEHQDIISVMEYDDGSLICSVTNYGLYNTKGKEKRDSLKMDKVTIYGSVNQPDLYIALEDSLTGKELSVLVTTIDGRLVLQDDITSMPLQKIELRHTGVYTVVLFSNNRIIGSAKVIKVLFQ